MAFSLVALAASSIGPGALAQAGAAGPQAARAAAERVRVFEGAG